MPTVKTADSAIAMTSDQISQTMHSSKVKQVLLFRYGAIFLN